MKHGFSLVELSIVLVILGLLTGGILTGQNLIRAAELRSVTSQLTGYQSAIYTFRDKYFGLPGDLTNATDFWDAAHSTPATCKTTEGTGTQTCNGDGNGQIDNPANAGNERFRAWQHLANAGLIEGSYSGVQGPTDDNHAILGENVPAARVSNVGWYVGYLGNSGGSANTFNIDYENIFYVGATQANDPPYAAAFTPEELWNIDTKLDDGKPARGRITAFRYPTCTDAADQNALDASYDLSSSATGCVIFVKGL